MTEPLAYKAMVEFLEERNKRLPSDALANLLSDLSLTVWADGEPADPAMKLEWDRACERAAQDLLAEEVPLRKAG